MLLGAIGGPEWGTGAVRPEQGILKLRKEMQTYGNLRPCFFPSESLVDFSPLKADIVDTLRSILPDASDLGTTRALVQLREIALEGGNDSTWLRRVFAASGSLADVVHAQSDAWMKPAPVSMPLAV